MRRTLTAAPILLLASCAARPIYSFVTWRELSIHYAPAFVAEGTTLKVRVRNPGGGNIVSLDAFARDGDLLVGAWISSSGPGEWRWLTLDVSPFDLGPHWHERVHWWCDGRSEKVDVLLGDGPPKFAHDDAADPRSATTTSADSATTGGRATRI